MRPGDERKKRVERAFSRAASTYDEAAWVQREVAGKVASFVLEKPPPPGSLVVEVGSGTGLLTERLVPKLPDRRWLITDLSPSMLDRCRERIGEGDLLTYRVMDGEWPSEEARGASAIVSSLAFQWFDDLPSALERLRRCLAPGGRMVFSVVAVETFHEWRRCLSEEGASLPESPFISREELSQLATILGEERIVARFDSGRAFLESLEALGVTVAPSTQATLGPGLLRRAMRRFGGEATYHVLYGALLGAR